VTGHDVPIAGSRPDPDLDRTEGRGTSASSESMILTRTRVPAR
jgi:hypothetical protein